MTADGHFRVPTPINEPVRLYAPGDPHRKLLKARLADLTDARTEVPMQVGGERRWGASRGDLRSPHRHELTIAEYAVGGPKDFDEMDCEERIRACYQHCVLKWVMLDRMTNQSLRKRFQVSENKSAAVSQVIAATIDAGEIVPDEKVGTSRRFARYVPYWA